MRRSAQDQARWFTQVDSPVQAQLQQMPSLSGEKRRTPGMVSHIRDDDFLIACAQFSYDLTPINYVFPNHLTALVKMRPSMILFGRSLMLALIVVATLPLIGVSLAGGFANAFRHLSFRRFSESPKSQLA